MPRPAYPAADSAASVADDPASAASDAKYQRASRSGIGVQCRADDEPFVEQNHRRMLRWLVKRGNARTVPKVVKEIRPVMSTAVWPAMPWSIESDASYQPR